MQDSPKAAAAAAEDSPKAAAAQESPKAAAEPEVAAPAEASPA